MKNRSKSRLGLLGLILTYVAYVMGEYLLRSAIVRDATGISVHFSGTSGVVMIMFCFVVAVDAFVLYEVMRG